MTFFLFDLDGTITKEETLPLIARHFNVQEEIESLTKETVAGNVPFVESFMRRVYILGKLPVDEVASLLKGVEIYQTIACFIKEHLEICHIVTGNLSCWAAPLLEDLGCHFYASEAVVEDNRIARLATILQKENVVRELQRKGHKVVFVGDGNNDVEAMRAADVSIASALTHKPAPGVLSVADYLVLTEAALCRHLNQLV